MQIRGICLFGVLLCTTVSTLSAQDKAADQQIEAYLAKESARLSDRFLAGASTVPAWEAAKPRLTKQYFEMLGLWPLPAKTPLEAQVTGKLERGEVVIEMVHFQSKPGLYVTGNLYRPKQVKEKLPAILYVCGHSGKGRDGNKTAFQEHGMWFASNGYVALLIDTLQLGELAGTHHGTYNSGRWWWQSAGYTPAGVECWNGIRALDYLETRPEVDAKRLGVTGISGGGATTFWIAAADERVKCAVPVSGMSDLESYIANKVINGHCDCMFLVNSYGWEWTTNAAMIAPRPMLFANSDQDRIFPMDGNRRIIDRLRKFYKLYDKPDLVDEYVSVGGHDYRPDLRIAIFRWFNKHLKNETREVKDANFEPLAGKELRVFPTDADLPKDSLNKVIDETFVRTAKLTQPEPGQFAAWQKTILTQLRDKCFHAFPEQIPAAKLVKKDGATQTLETEPGITVSLRQDKVGTKPEAVLLVLDPFLDKSTVTLTEKTFVPEGASVFVLELHPHRCQTTRHKAPPNYVVRAHALVGRSADQGSVYDIAACLRYLSKAEQGVQSWKVIGRGQNGVLAAYAQLLEPIAQELVVIEPTRSHDEGPIFLQVLRVLDVPTALGLLAPTSLTIVNGHDELVKQSAQLYKLAGAETKLKRKQAAFR